MYDIPGPGFGIAADETGYQTSISENAFQGNLAAAMFLADTWYGMDVVRNTSNDDGSFVVLVYTGYGVNISYNQGQNFSGRGSYL